MRKVVHEDLKYVFGRAAEDAWEQIVQKEFFHAGRYDKHPKDVQELNWSISIMGLHSERVEQVSSRTKRINLRCAVIG